MIISICKTIMFIVVTIIVVLIGCEIICEFFGTTLEDVKYDIEDFIYCHILKKDE